MKKEKYISLIITLILIPTITGCGKSINQTSEDYSQNERNTSNVDTAPNSEFESVSKSDTSILDTLTTEEVFETSPNDTQQSIIVTVDTNNTQTIMITESISTTTNTTTITDTDTTTNTTTQTTATTTIQTTAITTTQISTTTETTTEITPNTETTQLPLFNSNTDMIFTYKDYPFSVNANIEDILSNIGEPLDLKVAPSCFGSYDDKTYTYDGFIIYTYTLDGSNYYVQEIELNAPSVATNRGITVGCTLSDLENTYGTDYKTLGNEYRYYSTNDTYLFFYIDNNVITHIGYIIEIDY